MFWYGEICQFENCGLCVVINIFKVSHAIIVVTITKGNKGRANRDFWGCSSTPESILRGFMWLHRVEDSNNYGEFELN